MQFLRSLFWVIIAVAMLIFAVQNDKIVTVNLWGGLQADVKLWLLVLGPLLLGFLPTWIFHRIALWQERRHAKVVSDRAQGLPTYDMATGTPSANTATTPASAFPAP